MPHIAAPCGRRDILRAGSLGLLGMSLPELQAARAVAAPGRAAPKQHAKAVILLFMWGGPGQHETWDLKPEAPAEVRGEFQPIATNVPGIEISEHFPRLAQRCDQLAIIRSMTHTDVNHTTATHFLLTGQPPLPPGDRDKDWPNIGAVLAQQGRGREPLPPFVQMRPKMPGDVPRFVEESRGQWGGWLGSRWDPLTIDARPDEPGYRVGEFDLPEEVSSQRLARRESLLGELEARLMLAEDTGRLGTMSRYYSRAFDLLADSVSQSAFDLTAEPDAVRDRYGRNPHGQSVLQARRLVERGVPFVTVFWPNDGIKNVSVYWDTHSRNFIDHRDRLMPPADQAFATLLDDLSERGLLDETLVVWTGEFGRTPKVGQRNSDAGAGADGRDHWPNCFSSVLAGGGIKGGQVYGASDRHGAYPAKDPVAPVDLVATIYDRLGVPPGLELHDGLGRPFIVCPGRPITALCR
ncbi:MAG: DUF1501 domain-containing protein [Planctomycetaceae bacterium]